MLNATNSITLGCVASVSLGAFPIADIADDFNTAVAFALAKAGRYAQSAHVIPLHLNTASQISLPAIFQTKGYMLSESAVSYPTRYVTSQEDQILRRASMRASTLVAKGRLISK